MDLRALSGAVLVGATLGVMLGASFVAGSAARGAAAHARAVRLASAAAHGFSDAALNAETAAMDPGAAALARRFDPMATDGSAVPSTPSGLRMARLDASPQSAALASAASAAAGPRGVSGAVQGSRELDCLTDAVYYEARGESSAGQAAVAQVVMNRVHNRRFPDNVCAVVYQGVASHDCQFSFACDGSMHRPREPAAWRRAQSIAARALDGFVMAQVRDATNFHVASLGAIWGDSLVRVAQIGSHVFYKLTRPNVLLAHAGRAGGGADGGDGKAAGPADGGQPTLILASALTEKPVSAPAPAPAPAASPAPAPVPAAAAKATAQASTTPEASPKDQS